MDGSTQLEVASIARPVGRKRINAEGKGEEMTARFRPGTMARIKVLLAPGEPIAELFRQAVERELHRRTAVQEKLDREAGERERRGE